MKRTIIFLSLLVLGLLSHAQTKNRLVVTFGIADNGLIRKEEFYGLGAIIGKGSLNLGFKYNRSLNNSFSVTTGLNYSENKIELRPAPGIEAASITTEIEMITIPVLGQYNIGKFLYVTTGPLIDMELNTTNLMQTDKQSGIGLNVGIGGQYSFKNIAIFINPFFNKHAVIPFNKEQFQQHITELGLNFGLGYNFKY